MMVMLMMKPWWIKGVRVYTFNETDSTNLEAARRIRKGVKLPALFVAKSQTAGKGTRGRSFYSDGGGLYMSLAVNVTDTRLQKLTILAAVATAQSIEKLTGKEVQIKWVNDIYIKGKKVCGILCERVEDAVIIGIGINLWVENFPEEIKDIAANLNAPNITPKQLAKAITNKILYLLNSNEDFMPYYKNKSILIGKEVTYIQNNTEYSGRAIDIVSSGGLVVEDERGNQSVLSSGDVMLKKL